LRDAATVAGVHVGTCVMPDLLDDPIYAATVEREFTHVVVEHHMKWEPLTSPAASGSMWGGPYRCEGKQFTALSGCYDFGPADKIVDWALARGLKVKGHTLCWHVTSPAWLDELDAEQCAEALRRHIFTTCGHFRGRVESWDVVNEALAPDGSLADNVFLRKMGSGYIAQAFRWAKQADPEALLYYNDNKVEGADPSADNSGESRREPKRAKHEPEVRVRRSAISPSAGFYRKSDAMFELLRSLLADGVPIDGVGLQAHFNAAGVGVGRCPTPEAVVANIARLKGLGSHRNAPFLVNISEMDVRISKLPANCTDWLRAAAQCQIYHDILAEAVAAGPATAGSSTETSVSAGGFTGITLWGFTDKHTWVTDFYHADAPLIFDNSYQKKPSYYAVRQAFLAGNALHMNRDSKGATGEWGEAWMQPEPEKPLAVPTVGISSLPDWQQPGADFSG
jgi:endo-1,4-beta-xylanase